MVKEYVRVVPVLVAEITQVVEASFMLDGAVRDKSLLEVRLCDVVQELCLSACNPLAELTTKVSVLTSCPPSVKSFNSSLSCFQKYLSEEIVSTLTPARWEGCCREEGGGRGRMICALSRHPQNLCPCLSPS